MEDAPNQIPCAPTTAEAPKPAPANTRGRPSAEGRFVWLSCLAIERIVNALGQTQGAFGLAVYVALARLSGRARNAATVEETIANIARMACVSYRKALYILEALEQQAKVIRIDRSRKHSVSGRITQAPSRYTLLRLHAGKSEKGNSRLHAGKSERRFSDCTEPYAPVADKEIDSPGGGESIRESADSERALDAPLHPLSVKEAFNPDRFWNK